MMSQGWLTIKKRTWLQIVRSWETYAVVIVAALALHARLRLWQFESVDYLNEIRRWYEFIRENGFRGFKYNFFPPYTPLYLYMFYLGNTVFPNAPDLLVIKMVSILADFVCAFFVHKLVRLKYPTGTAPLFAFTTVLLAPTVVWNGALWAQCDALYTAALLSCIYFLAADRRTAAFIAYGMALSLKLQSIFLGPFLLILLLKGRISWKHLLLVPLIYVITILPAWFVGRPLIDLLTIHFRQLNHYQFLTMNAPNAYQWVPPNMWNVAYPAGLTWSVTLVSAFCLLVHASRTRITKEVMIRLATMSLLMMPFFLPRMHERYFFPADLLSIVFGFYFPRYFFVPILVQIASFLSYFPFLFGHQIVPLSVLAVVLLITIIVVSVNLAQALRQERPQLRLT